MCGIAGMISGGRPVEPQLRAAEQAQRHRGPDGTGRCDFDVGKWVVGLGHQRLAVIDLSAGGAQPMFGPAGTDCIIFNGELYNYIELRDTLRAEGVRFSTETDTEVVAAALREWGVERALERFNGMWAFAWLDLRGRRLVLSRDRVGEKPLYFRATDNGFVFASELKGLLAMSGSEFSLNLPVVRAFLKQSLLDASADSMLHGVSSLPGGAYLTVDLSSPNLSPEIRTYWQPPTTTEDGSPPFRGSEAQLASEIRELFLDSVRLRLRSDVPVGVLLSGGIDSSAIACAVHGSRGIGGDVALLAAVSSDQRFDESRYVDIVGSHLDREVHKVNIDLDTHEAFDLLERATWHNDEPVGSFTSVAHYKLMEAAKSLGVTVVLSGQGADELLCGYKKYLAFHVQELLRDGRYFAGARSLIDSWRRGTVLRQFNLREARRYLPRRRGEEDSSVLGPALRGLEDVPVGLQGMSLQERQALDLTSLSVPALTHYEDRMSMAHGREVRLPFLDVRLMERLLPLGAEQKLRDGWSKYIFRKAMQHDLPPAITWRKDKQGFSLPQGEWLRGAWKGRILDIFTGDAHVFRHGLIDQKRFLTMYDRFSKESEERGTVWYQDVFNVLSMELWLRRNQEYVKRERPTELSSLGGQPVGPS